MKRSHKLYLLGGLLASAVVAGAAGVFQGFPTVGSGATGAPGSITGTELIPADTNLASGQNPQTVLIPSALLANLSGTPRNALDNGALNVTLANGTSTVTGQINAAGAVASNLGADRWLLSTNVAAGAGRTAIVTATPTPPAGFTNVMKVFRTSGALTQPICVWQEVPTAQATLLSGKQVTFSANVAALAGLAADNNNQMQLVIITGTGTDQGFGSWTASPAITPAWTGIATPVNTVQNITTTFSRPFVTTTLAATVTEIGVGLCFTPTATGAGATDGFAWTGAQLEVAPSPTAFEVAKRQDEINRAQEFLYIVSEGAGPTPRGTCHFTTANTTCQWDVVFPQPMYLAPTFTFAAGFAVPTTTAETALTACTALAADATFGALAAVVGQTHMLAQCTTAGTTAAVGLSLSVSDNGGTGKFTAWAGM